MLRPYRDLLTTPGGWRFSVAAFVARLPISMVGLGIVLLVVSRRDSYGLAGAVTATFTLVNAATAPVIGRLADRLGQTRVLAPAAALQAAFLLGFAVLVTSGAPVWTYFAAAAGGGCFAASVGSLVRARWGHVLGSGPLLTTAYAYESVLDEVIFVVGPLLVTLLATQVVAPAGLVAAVVLLLSGSAALLAHRVSEPPPAAGHEEGHPSALRAPGLLVLTVMMGFIGGVFGSVELSAVAFADEHGREGLAGPLLACYTGGSAASGLVFGAVHWQVSARRRLLLGAAAMTVTATTLPFVGSLEVLPFCLFVAGLGIAPTLISGFSLVERIVPAGTVTEGLTWATTGLIVGFSGATWLAGQLVDGPGVSTAFTVAIGSGLGALLVCALGYGRLPR